MPPVKSREKELLQNMSQIIFKQSLRKKFVFSQFSRFFLLLVVDIVAYESLKLLQLIRCSGPLEPFQILL